MSIFTKNRLYKGKSLIKDLNDYTVVDIETTSLDSSSGEILEISAVKVRDKKVVDTFSNLIKINDEVGPFTTNLTGITNEMVLKEGKDLTEVLYSFKEFLEILKLPPSILSALMIVSGLILILPDDVIK